MSLTKKISGSPLVEFNDLTGAEIGRLILALSSQNDLLLQKKGENSNVLRKFIFSVMEKSDVLPLEETNAFKYPVIEKTLMHGVDYTGETILKDILTKLKESVDNAENVIYMFLDEKNRTGHIHTPQICWCCGTDRYVHYLAIFVNNEHIQCNHVSARYNSNDELDDGTWVDNPSIESPIDLIELIKIHPKIVHVLLDTFELETICKTLV
jgi:hypothetical protein